MRGIYHTDGKEMQNSNFFGHSRKMNDSWYNGSTGIDPLDYTIKSTIKHSYAHHIERLMIQANIMNLCEIHPKNVYKWFMEMYIDSSDWVMTPNIYSMGLYADGGIMATKPYICGSNYIMKMMDFKKGVWCNTMDGLYWRFINKNRDYFRTNARSSMMVTLFDKMNAVRKKDILSKAEDFIQENTQKND
jgi:deoxyribodipyrimidine photolyase-related protein